MNYVTDPLSQCSLYKNMIYYYQYPKKNILVTFIIFIFKNNRFFVVNTSKMEGKTQNNLCSYRWFGFVKA